MPSDRRNTGPEFDASKPSDTETLAAAPTPEERDDIARSKMIELVAIGFGLTSIAAGVIAYLADFDTRGAAFAMLSALMWTGAYSLNRRGYVRGAAWILSIGLWATVTSSALVSGGIEAPQLASLAVVVLAAGLLIDRSAAMTATVVASLTIAALVAIDAFAPSSITPFEHDRLGRAGVLITMLFGSVLILFVALRRIETSREESTAFQRQLEQRNAELELARERYREINDLTSEYFYSMIVSPSGEISNELISPHFERATGYSREELTAERYWGMVHPDDRSRVAERAQIDPAHRPRVGEHRIVTKSGETLWLRDHSEVKVRKDGTVRLYGASRDITEEKRAGADRDRMEIELRQAQKMDAVGRLAGGVAHDFNNLLTVISGFSEILAEQVEDEAASENVEQIRIAADRAAELTGQLMAFSRRPLGDDDKVDINKTIGGLDPMLSRLLGEDIQVVVDLEPEAGHVTGEPGLFEQVLVNLAVNARDAMPRGGTLRFETRLIDNGASVRIRVCDTGVGMTDAVASHVFEPFYTTKGLGEGTGLGLSTVYGIIQRFRGSIQLDTSVGNGCTFEIVLPSASPAAVEQDRSLTKKPTSPLSPKTILVVEDEDRVRQLVCTALEAQGHRVLEADCGDAALRAAETSHGQIDLLVTDVVMPGMDGFELTRILRGRDPNLRVLITSGYANQQDGSRRQLPPEASFLQKPFSPRDIAAKLAEIYG